MGPSRCNDVIEALSGRPGSNAGARLESVDVDADEVEDESEVGAVVDEGGVVGV